MASTLDIADDDFLNGNYSFFKQGADSYLINQGRLAATPGGYIALLSQAIDNQGLVLAPVGSVALAAGEKITLGLDNQSQISVVVDDAVRAEVLGSDGQQIKSAIDNSGTIQSDGGKTVLSAKVLNDVFDHAVNNSGVIQADSIQERNGVVEFVASGAPVTNTGTVAASNIDIKDTNSSLGIESTGFLLASDSLNLISDGDIYIL